MSGKTVLMVTMGMAIGCCAVSGLAAASGMESLSADGAEILSAARQTSGEMVIDFKRRHEDVLYKRMFELQDRQQELQDKIIAGEQNIVSLVVKLRGDAKVDGDKHHPKDIDTHDAAAKLYEELLWESDKTIIKKSAESSPYPRECPGALCQNYYGGLPYDTCYSWMTSSDRQVYECYAASLMIKIGGQAKELSQNRRALAAVSEQIAQIKRMLDGKKAE